MVRLARPSALFVAAFAFFVLIPSYIVAFTGYEPRKLLVPYSQFQDAAVLGFYANAVYFAIFAITLFIASRLSYRPSARFEIDFSVLQSIQTQFGRYAWLAIIFSIVSVLLYAFNGGLEKLALLGTEIASRDFRFLNFNEVPRVYTALLQIARRFLIPLLIVYFFCCWAFGLGSRPFLITSLIALQVFASALTFARAPFLTLVVAIFIVRLVTMKSVVRTVVEACGLLFAIVLTAGITTYLQYNITDFGAMDVVETGIDFLVNRAWLVPSVVPVNLVFAEFDGAGDFLFLEYSRLGGLFGYEVVGTLERNSVYVAPVGFIADIWRNFGPVGIVVAAVCFAVAFRSYDRAVISMNLFFALVYLFLATAATFYLIMGVLFSQGAVFSLVLLTVFPIIAKQIDMRRRRLVAAHG